MIAVYISVIVIFVVTTVWALTSSADAFFFIADPIVDFLEGLGKGLVASWRIYLRGIEMTIQFLASAGHMRIYYAKPKPVFPPLPWWGGEQRSLRLEREAGLVFDDDDLLLPGYHHEKHVQMMIEVAPGLAAEHLVRVLCEDGDGTLRFPNGELLILARPIPMADAKPYLVMSTPILRTDQGLDIGSQIRGGLTHGWLP